jgi:hypothetical protein
MRATRRRKFVNYWNLHGGDILTKDWGNIY